MVPPVLESPGAGAEGAQHVECFPAGHAAILQIFPDAASPPCHHCLVGVMLHLKTYAELLLSIIVTKPSSWGGVDTGAKGVLDLEKV